jgi:hypothetical protein
VAPGRWAGQAGGADSSAGKPIHLRGREPCLGRQVVEEATWGADSGIGTGSGAPQWLWRAFSLLEAEDLELDLSMLDALEKVGGSCLSVCRSICQSARHSRKGVGAVCLSARAHVC